MSTAVNEEVVGEFLKTPFDIATSVSIVVMVMPMRPGVY
jgi:hypothetical protein